MSITDKRRDSGNAAFGLAWVSPSTPCHTPGVLEMGRMAAVAGF